jgi:hypothetical protein
MKHFTCIKAAVKFAARQAAKIGFFEFDTARVNQLEQRLHKIVFETLYAKLPLISALHAAAIESNKEDASGDITKTKAVDELAKSYRVTEYIIEKEGS